MKCKNCGRDIGKEKFCVYCGKKNEKKIRDTVFIKIKELDAEFDEKWANHVIQMQIPLFHPKTKGAWVDRFDDVIADALELGPLRDNSKPLPDEIKAKIKVAKAQQTVNKIGANMSNSQESLSAFSKIEAKANKMLDEANAMTELNTDTEAANINNLAAKYETTTVDTAVEDELAALKASMGK